MARSYDRAADLRASRRVRKLSCAHSRPQDGLNVALCGMGWTGNRGVGEIAAHVALSPAFFVAVVAGRARCGRLQKKIRRASFPAPEWAARRALRRAEGRKGRSGPAV